MNKTFKKIISKPIVIILILAIIASLIAIHPNFDTDGVIIKSVEPNSPANLAGILNYEGNPLSKERINEIQGIKIHNLDDYYDVLEKYGTSKTITIITNRKKYTIQKNDNSTDLGLYVANIPTSNIKKGLDLQGGIRVVLKPKEKINSSDYDDLVRILNERMNIQGLKDIIVRKTTNMLGENYIVIEIAGSTKKEIADLLARQGKFVAKIGNETVFTGQDVKNVCRSGTCSIIESCNKISQNQYGCRYRFSVTLSVEASKKRAEITKNLDVLSGGNEKYLSKNITFYLDNEKINELYISADLKGSDATTTSISGYGTGVTMSEARKNTVFEMEKLQTILYTGKLPVQLEIVDFSEISPRLGEQFLKNAILVGILSILAVALVVYLRFRKIEIAVPVILTMLSEVILLLGYAALTGWNLDLASIAGIIVAAGTGVDDQIVIADEVIRGEKREKFYSWKKRIKNAFFIIMGSYFTTVVAMLPLYVAGAGQLKGFALTTILGISFGVVLTRPAFAATVEELLKNKK